MSLPWKPVAALPHTLEPTPILVAAPTGVLFEDESAPWLVGIFEIRGGAVVDRPEGLPVGLADNWLWIFEDELLATIEPAIDAADLWEAKAAHDAAVTGAPAATLCIGCGCDDANGCYDHTTDAGCYWLVVDRVAGRGVCSCCQHMVAEWEAGHRSAPAVLEEAAS